LRLVDAEGSIVAPSQFITAAERYRMMPVIDLWVVGAALNSISALINGQNHNSEAFTINLSGQSFGNKELQHLILDHLDRLEIPPRRVMFEITETAAISDLSNALEFMKVLRGRGCRFILDDFGSGLSSFRYLKSLDIELLKIDGELVRDIVKDPIQREMVSAIHRIGESMGIQTIGEWVEYAEIERVLLDMGVHYAQGWGIGLPVPFGE
jgi:EAL domain-containing protein (putative c-di-GMP-specific phosphodiesterase class I)